MANFTDPKRRKILFPHLGLTHTDADQIQAALEVEAYGYEVEYLNMMAHDVYKRVEKMNFDEYALVDFRNCRMYHAPENRGTFNILKKEITEVAEKSGTLVTSSLFDQFYSKEYLDEFHQKGINIIPTTFVPKEDAAFDLAKHLRNLDNKSAVIKPGIGSRAFHVYKVMFDPTQKTYSVFMPRMEEDRKKKKKKRGHKLARRKRGKTAAVQEIVFSGPNAVNKFNNWFNDEYRKSSTPPTLIQNYIKARELCFVYLGGKFSNVIERVASEKDRAFKIKHQNFNGKIKALNEGDYPAKAKEFADQINEVIKEQYGTDVPYYRIDVFADEDTDNMFFFLEVEAGVPGLYLLDSGKVDKFAEVLHQSIQQHQKELSKEDSIERLSKTNTVEKLEGQNKSRSILEKRDYTKPTLLDLRNLSKNDISGIVLLYTGKLM
ncbi:MAG: hypothetical protein ACTSXQ_01870 [Alphaproteobacteria bacterium]